MGDVVDALVSSCGTLTVRNRALAFRHVRLQIGLSSGVGGMLPRTHVVCPSDACSGKTRRRHLCAHQSGMRCGLPQASASAAAVWAGRPLMRRLRIVGTAERDPDPPPPKWLRPTRGVRDSLFRPAPRERQ